MLALLRRLTHCRFPSWLIEDAERDCFRAGSHRGNFCTASALLVRQRWFSQHFDDRLWPSVRGQRFMRLVNPTASISLAPAGVRRIYWSRTRQLGGLHAIRGTHHDICSDRRIDGLPRIAFRRAH
jgi:hypothetical protein